MANSIPLTVFRDLSGNAPATSGSQVRYYSASTIKRFQASTTSGIPGVNSRVYIQLPKGNGNETGDLLVNETAAAIASALG